VGGATAREAAPVDDISDETGDLINITTSKKSAHGQGGGGGGGGKGRRPMVRKLVQPLANKEDE